MRVRGTARMAGARREGPCRWQIRTMSRSAVVTPEMTDWTDEPVTVRHGVARWPDNPLAVLERVMDLGCGDDCSVSQLAMGVHSGRRMDGPVHFLDEAAGLDEMPLTATMGQARVIQIEHPREITAGEVRQHDLQAGERVLFRTSNSARCWPSGRFAEDFVYITEQAATHLAQTKVGTAGTGYLSADGCHADGARSTRSCTRPVSGSSKDSACHRSPAAGTR